MVCGSRVRRNIRSLGPFTHQRSTLLEQITLPRAIRSERAILP
jgi:hypothetical protein